MGEAGTKRPWLAAVLALLVTGLGHCYLRRWIRALGWFLVATLATIVFVPVDWTTDLRIRDVAPVMVVLALSALDAYRIALVNNRDREVDDRQRCPECNRHIEPGDDFCWYCAAEFGPATGE